MPYQELLGFCLKFHLFNYSFDFLLAFMDSSPLHGGENSNKTLDMAKKWQKLLTDLAPLCSRLIELGSLEGTTATSSSKAAENISNGRHQIDLPKTDNEFDSQF